MGGFETSALDPGGAGKGTPALPWMAASEATLESTGFSGREGGDWPFVFVVFGDSAPDLGTMGGLSDPADRRGGEGGAPNDVGRGFLAGGAAGSEDVEGEEGVVVLPGRGGRALSEMSGPVEGKDPNETPDFGGGVEIADEEEEDFSGREGKGTPAFGDGLDSVELERLTDVALGDWPRGDVGFLGELEPLGEPLVVVLDPRGEVGGGMERVDDEDDERDDEEDDEGGGVGRGTPVLAAGLDVTVGEDLGFSEGREGRGTPDLAEGEEASEGATRRPIAGEFVFVGLAPNTDGDASLFDPHLAAGSTGVCLTGTTGGVAPFEDDDDEGEEGTEEEESEVFLAFWIGVV